MTKRGRVRETTPLKAGLLRGEIPGAPPIACAEEFMRLHSDREADNPASRFFHRACVFYLLFLFAEQAIVASGSERVAPNLSIIKGPYLQNVTSNSIVVMWETNLPSDGKVFYGETPALGKEAACSGRARIHRVTLSALNASTLYHYRVSSGGVSSEVFTFKTAPVTPQGITFIVYGDNRTGAVKHQQLAQLMRQVAPEFILHTGDMVMNGSNYTEWGEYFFKPLKDLICFVPLYPTMGNHEALSRYYYDFFYPPEGGGTNRRAYYSFDYGPAHIASINVYEDYTPGSPQYKWLKYDLLKARNALWRFVFLHFPLFTSGERCYDVEVTETRAFLQDLFEECKVDIVFSAHDHIYERTFPTRKARRDDANGVVYVVTGGGGACLYDVNPQWWSAYAEAVHHYVVIRIHGRLLSLEAYDIEGKLFDQYRISKDGQEIQALIAQLEKPDTPPSPTPGAGPVPEPLSPYDKMEIASLLGQFTDARVVKPLVKLLDDPNIIVQRAAARALAATAQPTAVGPILERLGLGALESPTPLRLATVFTDEDILIDLAEALARSGVPAALRGLVMLADCPEELPRLLAIAGIRWLAQSTSPDVLRRHLAHVNPTIQRYAIAALRKLAQVVEEKLGEGDLNAAKLNTRLQAVKAIQAHADVSDVGRLLDILRYNWQDMAMRREILHALGLIDPTKQKLLKSVVMTEAFKNGNAQVRKEIAGLLDHISARDSVPLLIAALEDERVEIRDVALLTLQRIARHITPSIPLPTGKERAKWQAWYARWLQTQQLR